MPLADFSNTNAVVTGASSGIGRAIALSLANAGVKRLLIHYRANEPGALETASEAKALGADVVLKAVDLSDSHSTDELAAFAFERLGVVHTWVNNAGADVLTGESGELSFDEKLRLLFDVDVLGTIRLSRLVASRLVAQELERPPSMTFIGWDQAPKGMEGDAGQMFGPTKSAVMAYANSLAQTLAPRVRVNTIAPGWIQTKWGESTSSYWDERAKKQSLMQRWGNPNDVARAITFVANPANSFLTGQTIEVNGGWNRQF